MKEICGMHLLDKNGSKDDADVLNLTENVD